MTDLTTMIETQLLPVIKKHFPNFKLIGDQVPLSICLETTIGKCLPNNKQIWCNCINEMYKICKTDKGIHGLFNYFGIFLGENTQIGGYVLKDTFYKCHLDNEIIELWKNVN